MAPVRRIAPKPLARAWRRRLGVVAASLAGGVAGLAAGVVCVARVPDAASGMGMGLGGPVSSTSAPDAGGRGLPLVPQGVARVLAPAAEVGVTAARERGGEEGAP